MYIPNDLKTNIERVTFFMEHSSLAQLFVIQALGNLSDLIISDQENVRERLKDSFISADAWIQAAKDWQDMYLKFYGPPPQVKG